MSEVGKGFAKMVKWLNEDIERWEILSDDHALSYADPKENQKAINFVLDAKQLFGAQKK